MLVNTLKTLPTCHFTGDMKKTQPDWVLKGLRAGQVGVIAAPGGTGKSYLLMEIALSVALGQQFITGIQVSSAGPVRVLNFEDDEVDMIEAARISASDIFMDPMHEITRIFQTVILGQTLTSGTDGGTGNRALGEVHEKVRQDKATSDKRLVLPALQRPVDIMMAVNFPNSPVQVKVLFEENVGLAMDRMTRDKGLVDSGIVLGFDRSYIASSYGIGINSFVSGLELLDMNEDGVLEPGGEVAKIDKTESGEDTGDDDTNTAAGATTGTEHETGN